MTPLRVEPLEDRLAPAAGDLDPTFGTGGVVTSAAGPVFRLSLVPDGRVLSLQNTGTVARFEPDGDPDPTFGTGGVAAVPGFVNSGFGTALAALPDGGAVVGWVVDNTSAADRPTIRLARLTSTGAIDPTFGTGGTAVVTVRNDSFDASLAAIVVQADGRVVLAGAQTQNLPAPPGAQSSSQVVVARLTAAGQPDPSFGSGGTAIVDLPASQISGTSAGALAVQPDGRVVVAGLAAANEFAGTPGGPVVIRLTSTGQLDPAFGAGGTLVVPPAGDGFNAVRVLDDGRVVLAGPLSGATSAGQPTIAGAAVRLTADGRLDPTYDGDGIAVTPVLATGRAGNFRPVVSTAVDAFGRVVFDAGLGAASDPVFRLAASGAADAGFGAGGRVDRGLSPGIAVQANGDILLGGASATTAGAGALVRLIGSNPPAGFVAAAAGAVVAGGRADGTVQVLTPTGGTYAAAAPTTVYPGFGGTVRAAVADVTGDGTPDYVFVPGPGAAARVTVIDGATGRTAADFAAFEAAFTGGAFVAAADLDGDGRAEVVVTPDQGGGGRVVVFSVAPGGGAALRASFFGIDDANFRGGARAAVGDVNGDGTPDVVVAAGFGGGPRTAIFSGQSVTGGSPARLVGDFFAFPGNDAVNLRNGSFVASGDVDGDGFDDLIFGGGPGGAPRVFILDGQQVSAGNVAGAQAAPVANFFVAGNTTDRGGVRVAATDADGDARADVVVGSGEGSPARVRVYLGANFTSTAEPAAFQDVSVFGGGALAGGVFVG